MNPMVGPTGKSGNKIPKGYQASQLQQFTPEQMQLFQQMFGRLGPDSYLSKLAGGDQSTFEQIEAPAMQQFSGLLGNLSSRFSAGGGQGGGQGAISSRHSSGFQNETSSAAQNFASQLQSQRQGLQQQAIRDLMGFSNQLLGQRPYETSLYEKQQKGGLGGWGGVGGAALGGIGGFFAGGPAGAMTGAQLGHKLGSGFD
jgi:hypothetical protein